MTSVSVEGEEPIGVEVEAVDIDKLAVCKVEESVIGFNVEKTTLVPHKGEDIDTVVERADESDNVVVTTSLVPHERKC